MQFKFSVVFLLSFQVKNPPLFTMVIYWDLIKNNFCHL